MANSTVSHNSALLAFSSLVSFGLLFFCNIVIARKLGIENFGIVGFAQALGVISAIFCDGIKTTLVRDLSKWGITSGYETQYGHLIAVSTSLLTVSGLALFVLFPTSDAILYSCFLVSSFLMSAFFPDWKLLSEQEAKPIAVGNFLRYLTYTIALIVGFELSQTTIVVGLSTVLAAFVAAVYLYMTAKIEFPRQISFPRPDHLRRYALLAAIQTRNQGIFLLPLIVMGLLEKFEQAGMYNAAYKLINLAGSILNTWNIAMFPKMAAEEHGPRSDNSRFLAFELTFKTSFLIPAMSIAAPVCYLLGPILLGPQFSIPFEIVSALLLAQFTCLIGASMSLKLVAEGNPEFAARNLIISLLVLTTLLVLSIDGLSLKLICALIIISFTIEISLNTRAVFISKEKRAPKFIRSLILSSAFNGTLMIGFIFSGNMILLFMACFSLAIFFVYSLRESLVTREIL